MLIISQTFVYISGSLNASAKIEFSLALIVFLAH